MPVLRIRRKFIKLICIIGFIGCVILAILSHRSWGNMYRLIRLYGGRIRIWGGYGSNKLAIRNNMKGKERLKGGGSEFNLQQLPELSGDLLIIHFEN